MKLALGTKNGAFGETYEGTDEIRIQFNHKIVSGKYLTIDRRTGEEYRVKFLPLLVSTLSHETIHIIICRLEGETVSRMFDNIVGFCKPKRCGL